MPADPSDEMAGPQVPKTELEELQIKAQGVADEVCINLNNLRVPYFAVSICIGIAVHILVCDRWKWSIKITDAFSERTLMQIISEVGPVKVFPIFFFIHKISIYLVFLFSSVSKGIKMLFKSDTHCS